MKYLVLALLLSGCASLGLQTADTFNQKLAYSYGQVTAARKGATAVNNARCPNEAGMKTEACQSSVKSGQHVQQMADEARPRARRPERRGAALLPPTPAPSLPT